MDHCCRHTSSAVIAQQICNMTCNICLVCEIDTHLFMIQCSVCLLLDLFPQRFGHWLGEYLPIYQGYLFRIGAVLEWYHAKEVVNFTSTKDSASFLVSTTDREGRMLQVDLLPAPLPRQFTLNVAVIGKKADERLSRVYGGQLVACTLVHVALLFGTYVQQSCCHGVHYSRGRRVLWIW